MKQLIQLLKRIDGKSYKSYKDIQGSYAFEGFTLYIDYVQGDPFAGPSKIRASIPTSRRNLHTHWLSSPHRQTAVEDQFARSVGQAVGFTSIQIKGSGKSGQIQFDQPHQEVLKRTAVQMDADTITVCLSVGLPANGRRINGQEAIKLLTKAVPEVIRQSIFSIADKALDASARLADQQQAIRKQMMDNNWIAFIANGSVLPRKSGISDQPMRDGVAFQSPESLEVEVRLPHQSTPLKGMAIQKGITLIVGGGYHGKSTLLEAMERGVYAHTAGDGREFVLTDPDAVKIRAEDGRKVTNVNISPFIDNLPHGQQTTSFTTENASGSTSQAANVMESLEAGASTLLIDEDTSATNFMIRDHRMQKLVHKDKEPITPFIQKIKQLHQDRDVSTIMVMGGSGDYFSVADTVIMLDAYRLFDVTDEASAIIQANPLKQHHPTATAFGEVTARRFSGQSLQTNKGKRSKTQAKGLTSILMGRTDITFNETQQLVDESQTRMIAEMIQHLDHTNALGDKTLSELLDAIERQMDQQGLGSFTAFKQQHPGDLARPRRHEIAAVLNRMRTADVKQIQQ